MLISPPLISLYVGLNLFPDLRCSIVVAFIKPVDAVVGHSLLILHARYVDRCTLLELIRTEVRHFQSDGFDWFRPREIRYET